MNTAPANGTEIWFTIRTHEIDANKRLTIPSLMMIMQETSMHNALQLQISLWDQRMDNLGWVILRKEISVKRLPTLGEKIKVVTYPAGFHRIFAYRDYWVYDEGGNEIAHAASTWTLIDLETRKISKIPEGVLAMKIPDKKSRLDIPLTKIEVPDNLNLVYNYRIKQYDLDWNNHVNNIVFSKLMLQAVSQEIFDSKALIHFTIHIKAECHLDENVTLYISEDYPYCHHQMIGEDERVVAIARSEWGDL